MHKHKLLIPILEKIEQSVERILQKLSLIHI